MSLLNLTPAQLRQAADVKTKIELLQTQLNRLLNSTPKGDSSKSAVPKRTLSAATRAKIAKAAKARWAKAKAAGKRTL